MDENNEPKTLFGRSPEKLAHLISSCAGIHLSEGKNKEQQKADLLRDMLEDVLPLDPEVVESLPIILKRMYKELRPLAGDSLAQLLLNPKTDINAIEKIKEYSKNTSNFAESEVEHQTAITVYYTAIASALVFHNQKISQNTYTQLEESFSTLIDQKWITSEITQLFVRARAICKQKVEKTQKDQDDG